MENSEEILQMLERFTEQKAKQIPKKLDDYLEYVAKTGDSVFDWSNIKYLLREKLLHAIKNFNENIARIEDVPSYPNVDPFNFETMESMLLERFELFNAAPFTIQRLCELLVEPRKHYSRIDKYMRALEKNILVVTTIEPGRTQEDETSNGDMFEGLDMDIELNEQEEQRVIEIAQKILVEKLSTVDESSKQPAIDHEPKKQDQKETDDDEQQPKTKKLKLESEAKPELNATESVKETSVNEAIEILQESTSNVVQKPEEKLDNIHSEVEKKPTEDDLAEKNDTQECNSPAENDKTEMLEEAENLQSRNEHQAAEKNESVKNTEEISSNIQKEADQTTSSDSIEQVEERAIGETAAQPENVAVDQEQILAEESPTYSEITTEIDVVPEPKETVIKVTKMEEKIVDENSAIESEKEVSGAIEEAMESDESEDIVKDTPLDIAHIDAIPNTNMDIDRDEVGQQPDEAMDVENVK